MVKHIKRHGHDMKHGKHERMIGAHKVYYINDVSSKLRTLRVRSRRSDMFQFRFSVSLAIQYLFYQNPNKCIIIDVPI